MTTPCIQVKEAVSLRIRDEQKEQIRRALLQAGVDLIEEHGLEHTTIEAITRRAGVAKGTFYNYFKTKHDLVYAAVHEDTRVWEQELERIFESHPTTLERAKEVFRRIADWVEANPELNWIWLMERLQRAHIPNSSHEPGHFHLMMERLFAAGQAQEELRSDRSPTEFAVDMAGLIISHTAQAYSLGSPGYLRQSLARSLETYFQGANRHAP